MKTIRWMATLALGAALVLGALAGCSKQATDAPAADIPADGSQTAGTFDRGEIDPTTRLAMGILRFEGTENAVTPDQASEMLPLWQVLDSGSLKGTAETEAVIRQIESKMTDAQRAAMDAMEFTGQDIGTWMQGRGLQAPERTGQAGPGGSGGGAFQNMTEEERTKLREEFQNMTAEQRATRMAEMGVQRPEGAPEGGPGGLTGGFGGRAGGGAAGVARGNFIIRPVIDLLTERAAE